MLVNKMKSIKIGWIIVPFLFLTIFMVMLGANPLQRETIAPSELMSNYRGWDQHEFVSVETHRERSDVLDVFLPQWIAMKKMIRAGDLSLWNPLPGGGQVGVLELTRGALTPAFILFSMVSADWLGIYLGGLSKLLVASLGTYLLIRRFSFGIPAAFIGGFAFAICGFNTAWFYWPQVSTSGWIPWLLWGTASWFLTHQPVWLIATASFTALLMVGGFPSVSVYGLYASALFVPFLVLSQKISVKNTFGICILWFAAVCCGLLFAAVPLLATVEMLGLSDLRYRVGGTPYRFPEDLSLFLLGAAHDNPRVEKTLYTGTIFLFLSMYTIYSILVDRSSKNNVRQMFLYYIATIFTLAMIAMFELVPGSVLVHLPAVGTSPWSRFSILAGFCIAILGACGLDLLWGKCRERKGFFGRQFSLAVLIGLGIIQVADQSVLFRKFNTVSHADDFFPRTSSIDFISRNIGEMQSVVADNSFLVSGSLGAYGVGEWFAHGFKSNSEKVVLNKLVNLPFKTATAATFDAHSINLESSFYSLLGIRYVIASDLGFKPLRAQPLGGHRALPPLPKNTLVQYIQLEESMTVDAVGIVLGTYGQPTAPAAVLLELIDEFDNILSTSFLQGLLIEDNQNAVFEFASSMVLQPGGYRLRLSLGDSTVLHNLTAWYSPVPRVGSDKVVVNDIASPGAMLYTLYVKDPLKASSTGWSRIKIAGENVQIFENLNVPVGGYFVNSLAVDFRWSSSVVTTRRVSPDHLVFDYSGAEDGFLIVPMRLYPGWKAYSGGSLIQYENLFNVMPAIPVRGKGTVQVDFKFEPDWIADGTKLMVLGIVILIAVFFWVIRFGRYFLLRSSIA